MALLDFSGSVRTYFERPINRVGGTGGSAFSVTGELAGRVLKAIRVYRISYCICAIRVKFSGASDWELLYGTTTNLGSFEWAVGREFEFQEGERITELTLWTNNSANERRLGWIYFRTNFNRVLDWGMNSNRPSTSHRISVGSGICVGLMGRRGHHIDSLAFVFLRSLGLSPSRLCNVQYPVSTSLSSVSRQELQTISEWSSSEVVNWVFQGSREAVGARHEWHLPAIRTGLAAYLHIGAVHDDGNERVPKIEAFAERPTVSFPSFRLVWETLRDPPSAYSTSQPISNVLSLLQTPPSGWWWLEHGATAAGFTKFAHRMSAAVNVNRLTSCSVQVYTADVASFRFMFPSDIRYSSTSVTDAIVLPQN